METKTKLSTLWLFATLNYLYCDVIGLFDPKELKGVLAGQVSGIEVTQTFLFAASVLMAIPIAMVLLSRILGYRANRGTNLVAGALMTAVQLGTNFMGTPPTASYIFFSILEIAATVAIVWMAWTWHEVKSTSEKAEGIYRHAVASR